MNRALLEQPFDPAQIRQRKGRNGVLDYVEGHTVIARLNAALDGAWSFEVTHHEVREDEVVVVETLVFSVPQNKLLWAGVTETTNPKNATQVIKDVVAATVREMEKQGLARRGSK